MLFLDFFTRQFPQNTLKKGLFYALINQPHQAFLSWSRQGFLRFLHPLIALRKKHNLSNKRRFVNTQQEDPSMALETALNAQITDAVTQANVKVLADSPALSLGNLYQMVSQSLGLSAQNAVMSQQQSNIIHQAATTQGVNLIYAVDTAAVGDASEKISRADVPSSMVDVLSVLKALART